MKQKWYGYQIAFWHLLRTFWQIVAHQVTQTLYNFMEPLLACQKRALDKEEEEQEEVVVVVV